MVSTMLIDQSLHPRVDDFDGSYRDAGGGSDPGLGQVAVEVFGEDERDLGLDLGLQQRGGRDRAP